MTSLPGNRPVRSSEACGTDLHVPQRCGGPPLPCPLGGPPSTSSAFGVPVASLAIAVLTAARRRCAVAVMTAGIPWAYWPGTPVSLGKRLVKSFARLKIRWFVF